MRLALTLLVGLAFAAPASAAQLRVVDRGPASSELRTDGHRLIAWDTGQESGAGPCAGPALGRAHVAWSRGRDVLVRSLRSGKTRRVRLRASPRQLVLLRGQVFATVRGRLVEVIG